jgi:FO synthase
MNESISRAAGTQHGQETSPGEMRRIIKTLNREPRQRLTAYGEVSAERERAGTNAPELTEIVNTPAQKYERKRPSPALIKNERLDVVDVTGG